MTQQTIICISTNVSGQNIRTSGVALTLFFVVEERTLLRT